MIEAENIELVVYSSKDFYEFEESEEFTLTGARRGFLLFDSENWLQRLFGGEVGFGGRSADRTVIDPATGDMMFLEGVCDVYYPATEAQRPDKNIAEIAQRTEDLQQLFPNARILIRPWPVSEDVGFPIEDLRAVLADSLRTENVEVFLPPIYFYDEDWACDASFHPNAEGRDRLTQVEAGALINAMHKQD